MLFNSSFLQFDCFSLTLKKRWNFLAPHGPKPWRSQYDVSLPTKMPRKENAKPPKRFSSLANAYSSAKRWKKTGLLKSSSDSGREGPCGLTGFVSVGFLVIS